MKGVSQEVVNLSGMQVKNYNDIREGDILEAFREVEVKKTLK